LSTSCGRRPARWSACSREHGIHVRPRGAITRSRNSERYAANLVSPRAVPLVAGAAQRNAGSCRDGARVDPSRGSWHLDVAHGLRSCGRWQLEVALGLWSCGSAHVGCCPRLLELWHLALGCCPIVVGTFLNALPVWQIAIAAFPARSSALPRTSAALPSRTWYASSCPVAVADRPRRVAHVLLRLAGLTDPVARASSGCIACDLGCCRAVLHNLFPI
jgi:hypothetical protein